MSGLPEPRTSAHADISLAILRLAPLTTKEFESLLLDLSTAVRKTDEALSDRTTRFWYDNFCEPQKIADETCLPSERDVADALDMQRTEPRQEAWKRAGDEA